MIKKIIALFLALLCLMPLCVYAFDPITSPEGMLPFYDVTEGAWYEEAVEFCYVNNVINGMTATTFVPHGGLTRAQFVTMLANIEMADLNAYSVSHFTDVKPANWYYKQVAWAYQNGIVSGTSANRFSPNAAMSRETMAAMVYRYMQKKGYSVTVNQSALNKFTDRGQISTWAKDGMTYCVSAGLISGMTANTVAPRTTLTRAQAARILSVFVEKYKYGSHTHSFSSANCTTASRCTSCGLSRGLPLGHRIESYNCDTGGSCVRCGYTLLEKQTHIYSDPTCTLPATCNICEMPKGEPLGHTTDRGICERCGRESFVNGFDKVAYHLETDGVYLPDNKSYFAIREYSFTELEYTYTILEYYPESEEMHIINYHRYESGNYDYTQIYLTKDSTTAKHSYEYIYGENVVLYGTGSINIPTFTKAMKEELDSYEGLYRQSEKTNMNRGLVDALAMCDDMLYDLYRGGKIADLGFTSFK